MLRDDAWMRAADKEAARWPLTVHRDGQDWQFWALHESGAWYTNGKTFRVHQRDAERLDGIGVSLSLEYDRRRPPRPDADDRYAPSHYEAAYRYGYTESPSSALRMSCERLGQRTAPLFPPSRNSLGGLPAALKTLLMAEYDGIKVRRPVPDKMGMPVAAGPGEPSTHAEADRRLMAYAEDKLRARRLRESWRR